MSDPTRKAVRSDSDLPPAARLLFEQIWEMHHASEEGCYASNEFLGNQIGAAASSIRRYRRQLREAGYLEECKTGGRTYLKPTAAVSTDQNDQEGTQNADHSDQSCTEEAVSTDQDMSSNNPEGGREPAPARGESHDEKAVRVFEEEVRSVREVYEEDKKIKRHTDWTPRKLDIWREVCYDTWVDMDNPDRAKLSILFNEFDDEVDSRLDGRSMLDKMPGPPVNSN